MTDKIRPIVETYEVKKEMTTFTPEELTEYKALLKSWKGLTRAELKTAKQAEIDANPTGALYKRRRDQYRYSGYIWGVRIIDSISSKTLYDTPMMHNTRHHADRTGQRYIRRYNRTSSFTEKTGISADVKTDIG